jgi:hypothetical protein
LRNLIWPATGALAVLGVLLLVHVYETMPSAQAVIILGSAILAAVAACVVIVVAVLIREAAEDRRYRAIMDAAEAHIAPLRTGSRSAERAMTRFHREHGLLLLRRTSEATRRMMAALDGRRPRRSWLPSWLTQPAPTASPAAVEQPPADEVVEVHHDGPADGAELLTAPLGELPPLLHAALAGAPSPIGDQLEAELGTVPEPPPLRFDEDGLAYSDAPDNTTWRLMRDELFAMLAQPGEGAEGAGVAS